MYHCSTILVNIILLYIRHFNSENTTKANERDILTVKIQLKRSKNVQKNKFRCVNYYHIASHYHNYNYLQNVIDLCELEGLLQL